MLLQSPNCTMEWRCPLGKVRGSWSAAGKRGFHRSLHMHLGMATDSASANGAADTTATDNDLTQLRHQLLRSEQRRNNLHHAFQRMRKRVAELEHEVQCLASVANNCTTPPICPRTNCVLPLVLEQVTAASHARDKAKAILAARVRQFDSRLQAADADSARERDMWRLEREQVRVSYWREPCRVVRCNHMCCCVTLQLLQALRSRGQLLEVGMSPRGDDPSSGSSRTQSPRVLDIEGFGQMQLSLSASMASGGAGGGATGGAAVGRPASTDADGGSGGDTGHTSAYQSDGNPAAETEQFVDTRQSQGARSPMAQGPDASSSGTAGGMTQRWGEQQHQQQQQPQQQQPQQQQQQQLAESTTLPQRGSPKARSHSAGGMDGAEDGVDDDDEADASAMSAARATGNAKSPHARSGATLHNEGTTGAATAESSTPNVGTPGGAAAPASTATTATATTATATAPGATPPAAGAVPTSTSTGVPAHSTSPTASPPKDPTSLSGSAPSLLHMATMTDDAGGGGGSGGHAFSTTEGSKTADSVSVANSVAGAMSLATGMSMTSHSRRLIGPEARRGFGSSLARRRRWHTVNHSTQTKRCVRLCDCFASAWGSWCPPAPSPPQEGPSHFDSHTHTTHDDNDDAAQGGEAISENANVPSSPRPARDGQRSHANQRTSQWRVAARSRPTASSPRARLLWLSAHNTQRGIVQRT